MLFILKQIIKKQKKIIYYYYCFQCVSIFFYIFKDQEFLLEILSNNIYLQCNELHFCTDYTIISSNTTTANNNYNNNKKTE